MQDRTSLRFGLLSDEDAWQQLPVVPQGPRGPLPVWARALAGDLPFTTAAMLRLDFMHRIRSGLDPQQCSKMRWIAARANGCAYSEAYAAADLRRAGLDDRQMQRWAADPSGTPTEERPVLDFATKMTLAIGALTDDDV